MSSMYDSSSLAQRGQIARNRLRDLLIVAMVAGVVAFFSGVNYEKSGITKEMPALVKAVATVSSAPDPTIPAAASGKG